MKNRQKLTYAIIGLLTGFLIFGLKKNSEPNYFSRDEKYDIIYDTVSFYHINKVAENISVKTENNQIIVNYDLKEEFSLKEGEFYFVETKLSIGITYIHAKKKQTLFDALAMKIGRTTEAVEVVGKYLQL